MGMNETWSYGGANAFLWDFFLCGQREKLGLFYPIHFNVILLNRSFDAFAGRRK
jgi:hypothetical protein